jgi:hypothetical protein
MAAGVGQIEFKVSDRSGEEGFSNGRRVKLKTPGIDPELKRNDTANGTIGLQRPFAILRPLQATRSHALAGG